MAAIYYVDGDYGDDSNPGTEESPFETLKKAATVIAADDTVRIMSETIYENQVYFGRRITLEPADPDGMVTIDCENAGGGIEIAGVVRRIRFQYVSGDSSTEVVSAVVARDDLLVEGCEFYQCQNNYNGAAILAYDDLAVSNCTFDSCGSYGNEGAYGFGGAIYSGFPGDLVVVDSTFQDCFAAQGGGAVHVIGYSLIQRCRFENCYADGDGGEALDVVGGGHGTYVVNCLFAGNGNGQSGGGSIAIGTSPARLAYCTIVDNSGSAIWLRDDDGGTLIATHSIVWGNGEAFQEDGEGYITIYSSTIQDEPVNGIANACQVGVDPILASDYRLEQGSPCIDAESDPPASEGLFSGLDDYDNDDLDEIVRPRGMRYDHGCYESAYMEDAYEPNDTLSTAYDFTAAQTWLSAGKGLGVQADDDWYMIDVAPGHERVQVDCRFTHADGDIDIALYDADENLLDVSTSSTDDEFIDCAVPSAGIYYIKVLFDNAGNTYDLWWNNLAVNTYAVSYDANDATSGTVPGSQTKTQGVALTLAINSGNLAKTGYAFAGWNTDANGLGTDYSEGGSYTDDSAVTLFAKWTAGLPSKAISPSPGHEATGVDINAELGWANGGGATSYDVYFNGQFQRNQQGTSYEPGPLSYGTPYEWRIDAVNGGGTTTGDPWSFTTEPETPGEVFPGRGGILRILSSGQTRFLDIQPNGLVVWSNTTPGSSGRIQISSSIVPGWGDIHTFTAEDRVMNTQLGGADSAPAGMVLIPGGTNAGTDPDFGAYSLTVDSFYMDKYEVTKAQWDEVYAWAIANGYGFDNTGSGKATNHPVHTVSWYDCVKWCNARSQKEDRPAVYTVNGAVYKGGQSNDVVQTTAAGYRLPTDVEWEYAARGGATGRRFPWSDSDTIQHTLANYFSSSTFSYDISPTQGIHPTYNTGDMPYTSPIGSFAANGYGLHDIAGNVWEWCFAWHPSDAGAILVRGGSWFDRADYCRVGYCYYGYRNHTAYHFGFRAVLPPSQP